MNLYFFVKYLHVLGAIVILGTGSGIAFFMLMAHRSGDAAFAMRSRPRDPRPKRESSGRRSAAQHADGQNGSPHHFSSLALCVTALA